MTRTYTRREAIAVGAAGMGITVAGCTDDDPSAPLQFDSSVGEELRARVETVYDRTVAECRREIQDPVTIEVIDGDEMQRRAAEQTWLDDDVLSRLAYRTVGIIDDIEYETKSWFNGLYLPADDRIIYVEYPRSEITDRLIGHELLHAIQFQTVDGLERGERDSAAVGIDSRQAINGIVEGAATHLGDRLVTACEAGDYESCLLGEKTRAGKMFGEADGVGLVTYGAHANGFDFAQALAEDGGWDAIWQAHESPPDHTGQVLKPTWYPDVEPEPVEIGSAPKEWEVIGRTRVGMQTTFATLWLHDVLPTDAMYTTAKGVYARDYVPMSLARYRSTITDAWRGDQFQGYERSDGALGGTWRIRWTDVTAAERAGKALEEWADARGDRLDDEPTWRLTDERYLRIAVSDRDTVVREGPDPDAVAALPPRS